MIFPLTEWDAQEWLDHVEGLGIEVLPHGDAIMLRRQGRGIAWCLARSLVRELSDSEMREIRELVE